jgi:glycosyltransferase involved in cell wall biosynthesis
MQHLQPKVALVYDWLTTKHGGAEQVLLALHQAFPDAPLYTSIYDPAEATWAAPFTVKTTWLQKLPTHNHRLLSLLMPLAFESLDFSEFDIVITVSSAEAKGIITSPAQLHLSYVLTPPRYLYSHRKEYLESLPLGGVLRPFAEIVMSYLTWWDQAAAHRPDVMIPISKVVGERIATYYQRKPEKPLYPPVYVASINDSEVSNLRKTFPILEDEYYLVVSRLISYKRIDLAINACLESNKKLVIIGDGPERTQLQQLAREAKPGQIHFLGNQPQTVVGVFRKQCRAVLMPGIEDFGITALETLAVGKPVIVHQRSGAAELIRNNKTGVFLTELTVPEVIKAMDKIEELHFKPVMLQESVAEYATDVFVTNVKREIESHWQRFKEERIS